MKTDDQMNQEMGDLIEKHVVELAQHFDTVIVLATTYDGDTKNTRSWDRSRGNAYAITGHMREWLEYPFAMPESDTEEEDEDDK